MSMNQADKIIEKFCDVCIQCNVCLNDCALLNDLGLNLAEIAQAIFQDQITEATLSAIQRCDLCGRCGQGCLVNLNPAEMFKAARETLIQKGRIRLDDYEVMLMDREWNFFSIYRDTYGIHYDDLFTDKCEALFFPGCTLASYSPEVTRAAFNWLKARGQQVGFSDLCCGKPLNSIGLSVETEQHLNHLRSQIAASGATQIVTACPNCTAHLIAAHLDGVEIISIYSLLAEAGVHLTGSDTLTFHDACADRADSQIPDNVRSLLSNYSQVEMTSNRQDTICCGSGGIVSMIDPDLCTGRAQRRMAEFAQTGADTCVTSCMACAQRLARTGQPGQVRHCLEYIFDVRVDYAQVEANTHAMWEGVTGEINQARLSQARLIQPEDEGPQSND